MMDILIGAAIVAAAGFIVWLARHNAAPSVPTAKAYVSAVTGGLEDHFSKIEKLVSSEVSRVPGLVSSEVQRLTADLEAAVQRMQKAEAAYAAAQAAHQAQLASVASRVTAAIQASPELPTQ